MGKKKPARLERAESISEEEIEETGRIMLQCNTDYQFRFLMTVIDVTYGWCICARKTALAWCIGENVLPSHMSRNNSGLCNTGTPNSMPALPRLPAPRYHELDARGRRRAWRAARPLAALPGQDGHAEPGEPGVRQAFERFTHERDLQT
jgi:hypothetical protein